MATVLSQVHVPNNEKSTATSELNTETMPKDQINFHPKSPMHSDLMELEDAHLCSPFSGSFHQHTFETTKAQTTDEPISDSFKINDISDSLLANLLD